MAGTLFSAIRVLLFAPMLLAGEPSRAADDLFDGYDMTAGAGRYLVVTDANVRARPETEAERLTVLRKGERFDSPGIPKGTEWIAVRKDGAALGFVYKTVVAPLIDGRVKEKLTGKLAADGKPACTYTVVFQGLFKVPEELQQTADYKLAFTCRKGKMPLEFRGAMFITELPYLDTTKAEYQINVDILGVLSPEEAEGVFSVITIYMPRESKVAFDAVTYEELGSGAKIDPRPAASVKEALTAALEIAYGAWGPKLWTALAKS